MKLALHAGIGIIPGVKILSELPHFTLGPYMEELECSLFSCGLGILKACKKGDAYFISDSVTL